MKIMSAGSKRIDIADLVNTANRGRQLNALLQNIFELGTANGCPADDELVGMALDLSGKVSVFLDALEKHEGN